MQPDYAEKAIMKNVAAASTSSATAVFDKLSNRLVFMSALSLSKGCNLLLLQRRIAISTICAL